MIGILVFRSAAILESQRRHGLIQLQELILVPGARLINGEGSGKSIILGKGEGYISINIGTNAAPA